MNGKTYALHGTVWLYNGQGAWHFVSLPKKESQEINETFSGLSKGWGSIPVTVTCGTSTWKTSIFWSKDGYYILPLKSAIRKKEHISIDQDIHYSIYIEWMF